MSKHVKTCINCGPREAHECYWGPKGPYACKKCHGDSRRRGMAKAKESLSDHHICRRLALNGIGYKDIPRELIALKRSSIVLKKLVKERKQEELERWIRANSLHNLTKTMDITPRSKNGKDKHYRGSNSK